MSRYLKKCSFKVVKKVTLFRYVGVIITKANALTSKPICK